MFMRTPISDGDSYVKFDGKIMFKCTVNDKQQIIIIMHEQSVEMKDLSGKAKEIAKRAKEAINMIIIW